MNDEPENQGPNLEPLRPADQWAAEASETAPTAPDPPGGAPPRKPSWKTWVAVAVTAAVVGIAAVLGISAATSSNSSGAAASSQNGGNGAATAPGGGQGFSGQGGNRPGFGRPGGFGTISAIDGSTLTITDRNGTATKVLTSASTSVTTSQAGSVNDVKVGDTVTVAGTGSSTTIAATRVTDDGKVPANAPGRPGGSRTGPPGGGQGPGGPGAGGAPNMTATRGIVKSVGNGTFTVTGVGNTEVTVTTSSNTIVSIAKPATAADLKVGDTITVRGTEANGTITARTIRVGALGGPMGNRIGGPPTYGGASQ